MNEMALAYYRYCQRAQYFRFQPIKWTTYRKLWEAGLDFTYTPQGEHVIRVGG